LPIFSTDDTCYKNITWEERLTALVARMEAMESLYLFAHTII